MIEFSLLFLILCVSSVGTGRLYLWLIKPDNIFEFMQPFLVDMKRENTFIYKSLGGCDVCTRQRFTELSYLLLVTICNPFNGWYNWFHLALFIFYGGLAYYFDSFNSHPGKIPPVHSQTLEL